MDLPRPAGIRRAGLAEDAYTLLDVVRLRDRMRVQPEDDLAARQGDRPIERRGDAARRVVDQAQPEHRVPAGEVVDDLPRAVRRAPVGEEDLERLRRGRLVADRLQEQADGALLVVTGDDDRDGRALGGGDHPASWGRRAATGTGCRHVRGERL
jgi:hypothetical protein